MSETPSPSDAGRRSERVMLEIPIRVICFGGSGGDFSEDSGDWIIAHALMDEAKALVEGQPAAARQR